MQSELDVNFVAGIRDKALAFLEEWKIPPQPECYAIAYDLARGMDKELTKSIRSHLIEHKKLDADFLVAEFQKAWFKRLSVRSPYNERLMAVLNQLFVVMREGGGDSAAYLSQLQEVSSTLSHDCTQAQLTGLVDELMTASTEFIQRQQTLTARLNAAEQEMQELRVSLDSVRKSVERDPLTGISNRAGMENTIQNWQKDEVSRCGLILCDLDYFKSVNDNFGHLVGDRVLVRIARELKEQIKGKDFCCRWGGEEFAVLLRDVPNQSALESMAESIRRAVAAIQLIHSKTREKLPSITISLGVTLLRNPDDWDNLMERADSALYLAKERGRNRVVFKP